jgi:glycerol-3-phosphate dehydrogenase (NAD(P)+)
MFMVAEGVKSAPAVIGLAKKYGIQMPIAQEVYNVTQGTSSARNAFRGLLRAEIGAESEPG